jgi:hypothetical protein
MGCVPRNNAKEQRQGTTSLIPPHHKNVQQIFWSEKIERVSLEFSENWQSSPKLEGSRQQFLES